jgi:hypothetical protein
MKSGFIQIERLNPNRLQRKVKSQMDSNVKRINGKKSITSKKQQ